MRLTRTLCFFSLLCVTVLACAELAVPALTQRVTDMTATLLPEQKAQLEQSLQAFEARKGSQIGVLIVATTAPEAIEQYALRVVEQWKLGRKKIDDGALLIIAKDDRALRIEVGYGLEGALNDAVSKRIISDIITPKFKQGDYYGGIHDGLDGMMRVIDGEALPQGEGGAGRGGGGAPEFEFAPMIPIILMAALVMGGILRALLGRFPGAVVTGGLMTLLAWAFLGALTLALLAGALAFMFTLFGGGARGFHGGHRGGGFGGGLGGRGGSGGGFSGGGGGFGGGGASGKW